LILLGSDVILPVKYVSGQLTGFLPFFYRYIIKDMVVFVRM